MIEWGSFIVWLYMVYCSWVTPKSKPVKRKYEVKYSDPFDVWIQFKVEDKPFMLISNNQN